MARAKSAAMAPTAASFEGEIIPMKKTLGDSAPAQTCPIDLNTIVYDGATQQPLAGATIQLLDPTTSAAYDPAVTTTSRADGSFDLLIPATIGLAGIEVSYDGYMPSYYWGPVNNLVSMMGPLMIMPTATVDGLEEAFEVSPDPTKAIVVGSVGWTNGPQMQPVGCAQAMAVAAGDTNPTGTAIYFDAQGNPDPSRTGTSPANGQFLIVGVDASTNSTTPAGLEAQVDGDSLWITVPYLFAGGITWVTVTYASPAYSANPTPANCDDDDDDNDDDSTPHWTEINFFSGPPDEHHNLYAVWGGSSADVYAVGGQGNTNALILHYDGATWSDMTSQLPSGLPGTNLLGVWGSSSSDVFAVGGISSGLILHYHDGTWSNLTPTGLPTMNAVWGTSSTDVYIVGAVNRIWHWNGQTLTPEQPLGNVPDSWTGMWGSSPSDLYLVGSYFDGDKNNLQVSHYGDDDASWEDITPTIPSGPCSLGAVWGSSAANVLFVGATGGRYNGAIMYYNGASWENNATATIISDSSPLHGAWGSSATDVFAVGYNEIAHSDATGQWSLMELPPNGNHSLNGVWGSSASDVYAVGRYGTILHYGVDDDDNDDNDDDNDNDNSPGDDDDDTTDDDTSDDDISPDDDSPSDDDDDDDDDLVTVVGPFTVTTAENSVTIDYDSSQVEASPVPQNDGTTVLSVPGAVSRDGSPGEPSLPVFDIKVALPPDVDIASVTVNAPDNGYWLLDDQVALAHGQQTGFTKGVAPSIPMSTEDIAEYSNSQGVYPASPFHLEGVERMRKWVYVDCMFYAYGSRDAQGQIATTEQFTATIHFDRTGGTPPYLANDTFMDDLAMNFANYNDVADVYRANPLAASVGAPTLAILTRSAIAGPNTYPYRPDPAGVYAYADLLNSWGLPTMVVTDQDFGHYNLPRPELKARMWLHDNYARYNIGYVLLIGDPRNHYLKLCPDGKYHDIPNSNDLNQDYSLASKLISPAGDFDVCQGWATNAPSYTDRWYGDMYDNSNWDLSGDGLAGEFCGDYWLNATPPGPNCKLSYPLSRVAGGVHLIPNLYIGRIPIYASNHNKVVNQMQIARINHILTSDYPDFLAEPDNEIWHKRFLGFGTTDGLFDVNHGCNPRPDGSNMINDIVRDFLLTDPSFVTRTVYETGSPPVTEQLPSGGLVERIFAPNTGYQNFNDCTDPKKRQYRNSQYQYFDYAHTYSEFTGDADFFSTSAIDEIHNYDASIMVWIAEGPAPTYAARTLWHDDWIVDQVPEQQGNDPTQWEQDTVGRKLITTDEILNKYPSKTTGARFMAFLISCNSARWMNNPSGPPPLSEALLGKYAAAVVAPTLVPNLNFWTTPGGRFSANDIQYNWVGYLTGAIGSTWGSRVPVPVGKAFFLASEPPTDAWTGLTDREQYRTMLIYNVIGDPRLKIAGNFTW